LLLIDGGKTQISAVKEVLQQCNMQDIDVIGMVKNDKHRTRGIITGDGKEIELAESQDKTNRKILMDLY
jgi:excinuclease ABC subunit C